MFHAHRFKNPFAQPDLEKALLAAATSLGDRLSIRFGSRVTDLRQTTDDVELGLAGPAPESVRARYVVGADGGRSTVRDRLGLTMSGRSHPEVWLVADTVGDPHRERYGMHHANPDRPHVIVPGLSGRCRYEFRLFDGEGEAGEPVEFALLRKLVAPYRDLEPSDVERAVTYRFHSLVADQWRRDRVFLAGDAAHMMPPFAGQGLNSGLRDATNLCWKLAGVLQGRLREEVLDSYEAERRPHARAVVAGSERLGRVVMSTHRGRAARRDARVRSALRSPAGRQYLEQMRYRPEARFTTGLVEAPAGHDLVGRMIGQPRVFDTDRHALVPLDDVLGPGWSVLGVGVAADAWTSAHRVASRLDARLVDVPLDDTLPPARPAELGAGIATAIEVDGRLSTELASARGQLVLLRPDRFVAAVWSPAHDTDVLAAVDRWTVTTAASDTTHPTPKE